MSFVFTSTSLRFFRSCGIPSPFISVKSRLVTQMCNNHICDETQNIPWRPPVLPNLERHLAAVASCSVVRTSGTSSWTGCRLVPPWTRSPLPHLAPCLFLLSAVARVRPTVQFISG
ncbi:hypothetical protein NP493_378g02043 [Ridgeia piscesae]|uniref:Uncharacterized protein n=1 Tax=Ridgeia piscesae TaxID=27915 RepID=A0AAD9NV50_RIDPI|nr:hypothetical protein NP493_378g02043 [Ridgeia piscesae]